MSKFCSDCGAEIQENVKFCNNCGKNVQVTVVEPEVMAVKQEKEQETTVERKHDGFAITSLVLSLVGIFVGRFVCSILGLIFGILALNRIKKSNKKGRGMAIAGISVSGAILSIVVIVLFAAILLGTAIFSTAALIL